MLYPPISKFRTVLFIKKLTKLYQFTKDIYVTTKFIQLLENIKPSEELLKRIPTSIGSYIIYSDIDGRKISTPISILIFWKKTFRGCMKLSNGNQIASCLIPFGATVINISPFYKHRLYMIPIAQLLIRLAYRSSILEIDDLQEVLVDNLGASSGSYAQI